MFWPQKIAPSRSICVDGLDAQSFARLQYRGALNFRFFLIHGAPRLKNYVRTLPRQSHIGVFSQFVRHERRKQHLHDFLLLSTIPIIYSGGG